MCVCVCEVFVAAIDSQEYPLELDDIISDTARSGIVRCVSSCVCVRMSVVDHIPFLH